MKKAEGTLTQVLARRLMEVRRDRGLTLDQLSERTGLSKAYLCELEHGAKNPTLEVIERVALALRIDASTLLQEAAASRQTTGDEP